MGVIINWTRLGSFVWLWALFFAWGCGPSADRDDSSWSQTANTSFSLGVPEELGAGSVRICGERHKDADLIYPCYNDIRVDRSDDCPCFDLGADGNPVLDGQRVHFGSLCPSDNHPPSPWIFEYEIWSDSGCSGYLLNDIHDPHNNLRCYDIKHLGSDEYVNKSVEMLEIGDNHNQILCITKNATKDWSFYSCEDKTFWAECGPFTTVFDCGCEQVENQCSCPEGLLEALPWGCSATPANGCDIWCEGPYPVIHATFSSFGNVKNSFGSQLNVYGRQPMVSKITWTSAPHEFQLQFDSRTKNLTLGVRPQGQSKWTSTNLPVHDPLPELNSLEIRLTNFEQKKVSFTVSDVRLVGRVGPIGGLIASPDYGTRSHTFWLGPVDGNFTLQGKLQLMETATEKFSPSVAEASKIEVILGRNLTTPDQRN